MLPIIPDRYKDSEGCIGQEYAPGRVDFGDSCQRNFSLDCLRAFLGESDHRSFVKNIKLYSSPSKDDYYRRHHSSSTWAGEDDYRLSRDQSIPLVIAMGLYGAKLNIRGFMKHNLFFATNTIMNWVNKRDHNHPMTKWERIKFYFGIKPKDQYGIEINVYSKKLPDLLFLERWAVYMRGLNSKWGYPVIILGDLQTLLGSMLRRRNNDKDVLNHSLAVMYAGYKPSFLWPLIKNTNDLEDLSAKLRRYFNGPDPKELGEIYILALEKYL